MAENDPTSTVTPQAAPNANGADAAGRPAGAVATATPAADAAVADAASNVAGYIVPADEQHVDPQELMGGGEVEEPQHPQGKPGETVPLGVINSRP